MVVSMDNKESNASQTSSQSYGGSAKGIGEIPGINF